MKPSVVRNSQHRHVDKLFLLTVGACFFFSKAEPILAATSSEGLLDSPGTVKTVFVQGKTRASYELFLPSSYPLLCSNAPLVFAFSPVGNGTAMVNRLKPSCEKAGWVVVGCNRLRNGNDPMDRLMEWEILSDVRQRVPHDLEREYLAGFSGGASRSYAMTRSFWNEFAGVIAFCGWLEIYRPELVYPSRLAIAVLNGADDKAAAFRAESDPKILGQFQIRTKVFTFPGGHVMAPPETVDEAVQWLEADWQVNQAATMRAAKAESALLLKQASTALREEHHGAALEKLTQIVLEFSFTPAASAADEMMAGILNNPTTRTNALRSSRLAGNQRVGQILLARAEDRDGFPTPQRVANCELALALNPGSALAAAQLAESLAVSDAPKLRDLERAEGLSTLAVGMEPNSWYAWTVRASVAEQRGRLETAVKYQEQAVDLAPNNLKPQNTAKLTRLRSRP